MLASKFKLPNSASSEFSATSSGDGGRNGAGDTLAPPVQQSEALGLSSGQDSTFLQPPTVSLPPSGGAIRSLGEKFSVNQMTGSSSTSIPIATTPGRGGCGPTLTLSYDSSAGNGIFGLGWQANVPAVTRALDRQLPQYIDDGEYADIFVLSGAEDLVPARRYQGSQWVDDLQSRTVGGASYTVRRYRPRIEAAYARIERWTRSDGDTHWRTITRDNKTTLYGHDANSRIANPTNPSLVFSWLACASYDTCGNAIVYTYKAEDSADIAAGQAACEMNRAPQSRTANRYLKSIRYGNSVSRLVTPDLGATSTLWHFEVIFDYGEHNQQAPTTAEDVLWSLRPDPFSTYRPGFEVRTYRLCKRILMFHHFPNEPNIGKDCLVTAHDFVYSQSAPDSHSFLTSVSISGYLRSSTGYSSKSLPPVEFVYSMPKISSQVQDVITDNDLVGLSAHYQLVDLDGEGLAGMLTSSGGAWYYKPNRGDGSFAGVYTVPNPSSGRQTFMDLDHDGRMEFVDMEDPFCGYAARTYTYGTNDRSDAWGPITAFESLPNISWDDSNLVYVDLNGDGLSDILITEEDVLTYYPSLGTVGYAPPRQVHIPLNEALGPRCVFSDPLKTIHVADMSGDGLLDIVRVQNGAVSYWPNLGYGRFGSRVVMDGLGDFDTQEGFRTEKVTLADVDGSGTSDLVYVGSDGSIKIYFNASGNGFTKPEVVNVFPQVNNMSDIKVLDLLGNGTACLVWSSNLPGDFHAPLKYVELMETKPNLLISVINNRGLETKVHYAASTKFYLQDKAAGQPWITRLPFPVQIVESVESFDYISRRRATTRYAYHHGYYDGLEREFRGFAMVESWDTEDFSSLGGTWPLAANDLASSNSPPVLTKTWYHNGLYLDHTTLETLFRQEYFQEPGQTSSESSSLASLPESAISNEILLDGQSSPRILTASELRDAYRALRGSVLRTETYALDNSRLQPYPYVTTEQTYRVRLLQPQGTGSFQYGVFQSFPQETLALHYERQTYADNSGQMYLDPRSIHTLTLEVDQYGNVTQSASIAYGRRHTDSDTRLSTADQTKQSQMYATYTDAFLTNAILDQPDDYVLPIVYEGMGYEILKLQPSGSSTLISLANLQGAVSQLTDLPLDDWSGSQATGTGPYRRLLNHTRSLFRSNDLSKVLAVGTIESLVIPYENYSLSATDSSLQQAFAASGKMDSQDLNIAVVNEGHFVHGSDGKDVNWWTRSGTTFFTQNTTATPQQELAQATTNFFTTVRYRSPYHSSQTPNETVVDLDPYLFTVQETRDQIGNRMTVGARNVDPSQPLLQKGFDYVTMQPFLVMDANRNRAAVVYDEIGNVVATAVMGKPEEQLGDSIIGFMPTPDIAIQTFLQNPQASIRPSLLQNASTVTLIDVWAYSRTKTAINPTPVTQCSLLRENHVSDAVPTRIQAKLGYYDGGGNSIQAKSDAEPDSSGPQWTCTGWTVFNNKGNVVQAFQPFYSNIPAFQFDYRVGVSSTSFYDPVGRVVGVLNPDHTWSKTSFDPWKSQTWDSNRTTLLDPRVDPDLGPYFTRLPDNDYLPTWYDQRASGSQGALAQTAAHQSAVFSNVDSIIFGDSLGRAFMTINENKWQRPTDTSPTTQTIIERKTLDVQGREHNAVDVLGRTVMQFDYTFGGSLIHSSSMDAGEIWTLPDIAGKQLYSWNTRGYRVHRLYDNVRRPITSLLKFQASTEITTASVVYGDSLADPESANMRGQIYQGNSQGGQTTKAQYDFKGNLLKMQTQLPTKYDDVIDIVGLTLETDVFVNEKSYDALNRVRTATYYQDGPTPSKSISNTYYDIAGRFQMLTAQLPATTTEQQVVKDVQYTALNQRSKIDYGNGTSTAYTYDLFTQRITNLVTTRPDGSKAQNLQYTYDAAGSITNVTDNAQQTIYFSNTVVDPGYSYVYDAIGRLVQASGREHLGQIGSTAPGPWDPDAGSNGQDPRNGAAMARYTESYFYDQVNNIQSVKHESSSTATPGWTRAYTYTEPSLLQTGVVNNRLSSTSVGSTSSQYKYDGPAGLSGCMTSMPHLSVLNWGFNDMIQVTATQVVNSGIPETTYFQYDASNTRIRKVTNNQVVAGATPTRKSERIYLGPFEVYREYAANGIDINLERQSMSFSDGQSRVMLAETRTQGTAATDPAPQQLLRYQLSNQLDSCCIELDAGSALLTYEEYTPFGSSSYRATASALETPKRYRFAARERDDETGLYNYGARAYAPWLCRWISADPLGIAADGTNVFAFVRNNPIMLSDVDGMQTGGSSVPPKPSASFLRHLVDQAEYIANSRNPQSTSRNGVTSKYGQDVQFELARVDASDPGVIQAYKAAGFPEAQRLYGEVSIDRTTFRVIKVGGRPIEGAYNIDILDWIGPMVTQRELIANGQNPSGATEIRPGTAEQAYDVKSGLGKSAKIQPSHSAMGKQPGETVNVNWGRQNGAETSIDFNGPPTDQPVSPPTSPNQSSPSSPAEANYTPGPEAPAGAGPEMSISPGVGGRPTGDPVTIDSGTGKGLLADETGSMSFSLPKTPGQAGGMVAGAYGLAGAGAGIYVDAKTGHPYRAAGGLLLTGVMVLAGKAAIPIGAVLTAVTTSGLPPEQEAWFKKKEAAEDEFAAEHPEGDADHSWALIHLGYRMVAEPFLKMREAYRIYKASP